MTKIEIKNLLNLLNLIEFIELNLLKFIYLLNKML